MLAERERMRLRVARGELAAGVAGAGDDAGARHAYPRSKAKGLERRLHLGVALRGDVRDDHVLPYREAQAARAIARSDVGKTAHLRHAHAPDRQRHPAIDLPGLLLRMKADMRAALQRRPRLA